MAKEMQIFDVESQSKYHIELTEIKNMEDAGEHFVTSDELKEMGVKNWYYGGLRTFDNKITAELKRLKTKIEKSAANSCKIDDEELVDVLTRSYSSVSEYVKGLRRVGNRLSLHTKAAKTTPNKRDGKRYLDFALRVISNKVNTVSENGGFSLEVRGGMENVHEGSLQFIADNMKWDDFVACNNSFTYNFSDDKNLDLIKQMYDNPAIFNEKDDKKVVEVVAKKVVKKKVVARRK